MMKQRLLYFALIIFIIIIGLLSRHYQSIPLFIGDVLWAVMVYFMFRFLFIAKEIKWIVLHSMIFCYGIEFSQLYKAPWINSLRKTLFGRLVLGDTFLWGDMLSYTAGIFIAVFLDISIRKRTDKTRVL